MAGAAAPNKSALLLAIGGKPKGMGADKGEPDGDEDAAPGMGDVKRTAAEDAMSAFKSGDVDALSTALSDFVQVCKSEGY